MQQGIDKQLVRERFAKALGSYREHAVVQQEMALVLAEMICAATSGCRLERVLEVGAGTGALTAALLDRCRVETYVANDLVEESHRYVAVEALRHRPVHLAFLAGDIESIEALPDGLDLVASNATVQWLSDLEGFFRKMSSCLKPGGILAFSTFSPRNMHEIASIEHAGLSYPGLADIEALAGSCFELIASKEELKRIAFDSPGEVLRHIRKTGVNGLVRRSWTKGSYLRFLHDYREAYSCDEGVYLTYRPLYCCFRKRSS